MTTTEIITVGISTIALLVSACLGRANYKLAKRTTKLEEAKYATEQEAKMRAQVVARLEKNDPRAPTRLVLLNESKNAEARKVNVEFRSEEFQWAAKRSLDKLPLDSLGPSGRFEMIGAIRPTTGSYPVLISWKDPDGAPRSYETTLGR